MPVKIFAAQQKHRIQIRWSWLPITLTIDVRTGTVFWSILLLLWSFGQLKKKKAFYIVLGCSRLTMLWCFQVNSEGTQPSIHGLSQCLSYKESTCNAGDKGDMGSILDGEDPLEEEMETHASILAWKNPMDRGAWWGTVQRVA